MESIENDKPKSPLDTYWDKFKNFKINKDDKKINLTILDIIEDEEELIEPERLPTDAPLFKVSNSPVLKENSESPPSDMSQYFTKEEPKKEVSPAGPSLIEQFKKDWNERDEAIATRVAQEVTPTVEVSPEKPTAISSLLEQINARRNDNDVVGSSPIIENPILIVEQVETVVNKELEGNKDDPASSSLLRDINSRRLEYGTPNIASVGLPRPELSPINLNPASSSILPDIDNTGIDESDNSSESSKDNTPIINWNEEIKFEIKTGNVYNRFIDIDYGEHHKEITKVLIITNDGQSNTINPHTTNSTKQSIKWDTKGFSNSSYKDLEVYSITIIDINGGTNIYRNPNPKFLEGFEDKLGNPFS